MNILAATRCERRGQKEEAAQCAASGYLSSSIVASRAKLIPDFARRRCAFGFCGLRRFPQRWGLDRFLARLERIGDDLDVDVAGAAGDGQGAEGDRLAESEDRGAFKRGLVDDGLLREGTGAVAVLAGVADRRLLDLGLQAQAGRRVFERGIEVHSDVEVLELSLRAA